MFDGAKRQMLKRTIGDSQVIEAVATIISGLEVELLEEVDALEDAAGVDTIESVPTQDERKEALVDLVQAQLADDTAQFYVDHVASQHVENAESAKAYLGLSEEEWTNQIESWAETYRSKGAGEDLTDRELAAQHVERKFGVSIAEFERNVIEYDPSGMLERQLGGNVRMAVNSVRAVREALEEDSEA